VLTEDNELTLALLHRGLPIIAPQGCTMTTEVMTTWRDLGRQRLRWKRGALENLATYGLTPVTRRYWARQFWSAIGVLVITAYLLTIAWSLAAGRGVHPHPIWMTVTAVFALERAVTVRSRGPLQVLLAGTILVEFSYDVFLQFVQFRAFATALTGRTARW
jgi:cellulose synthase/poly-beta-1,6-N-acetylglucosamine synthase-like glycosyltransferase